MGSVAWSMILTTRTKPRQMREHGQLRSVAHSIADSLASGVSLMTGFYDLHVYEDALRSENGVLTVDLLNGKVIKGKPSSDLAAVLLCLP